MSAERKEEGQTVEGIPETLTFQVVSVSDRVSRGEYEDRSGPLVSKLIEKYFSGRPRQPKIRASVVPDEESDIKTALRSALSLGVDVIITTGGTGIGPRDVTPDVVRPMCDKLIPGIMEHIRTKYVEKNPSALLSRGVAGVIGRTLVYTLPGGLNAVEEYMREILPTIEHSIYMIYGIDVHGK